MRDSFSASDGLRLLQVFNQYLEAGGEELWVDRLADLSRPEVEVSELRFRSKDWVDQGFLSKCLQPFLLWNNAASRKRLADAAAASRAQVLLFHNIVPVGSLGLYDEASRLGLPVVQYTHNFRPFSPSGTLWIRGRIIDDSLRGNPWPEVTGRLGDKSFSMVFLLAIYLRWLQRSGALDAVKRWIAISDFMRDKFIGAGIPAERIVTLRHCWQPQTTPDFSRMGDYYLFLGRLVPEKGVHVLLKAWALLETRLGKACPRLLVAGTGPEEEKMKEEVARLKTVTCVGYVSGGEKAALLHGCRGLIAPSIWWEPLGLIVYEGYDYGRPVLAAASGGLTEIVVPGVTGYLHPAGDAAALADDVERAEAAGDQGRRAMGQAGREWLLANASPDRWRADFAHILHQAVSAGTNPAAV